MLGPGIHFPFNHICLIQIHSRFVTIRPSEGNYNYFISSVSCSLLSCHSGWTGEILHGVRYWFCLVFTMSCGFLLNLCTLYYCPYGMPGCLGLCRCIIYAWNQASTYIAQISFRNWGTFSLSRPECSMIFEYSQFERAYHLMNHLWYEHSTEGAWKMNWKVSWWLF